MSENRSAPGEGALQQGDEEIARPSLPPPCVNGEPIGCACGYCERVYRWRRGEHPRKCLCDPCRLQKYGSPTRTVWALVPMEVEW